MNVVERSTLEDFGAHNDSYALTRFRLGDFGEGDSRLGIHTVSSKPPLYAEFACRRNGSRFSVSLLRLFRRGEAVC